ncbi:MAG: hypothetical protein ABIZ18_14900, partial [Caldimonas sp.]
PFNPQPPVASRRDDDGASSVYQRRAQGQASSGLGGAADSANERPNAAPEASPAPMRERDVAKADKLGTGHGAREYSPTSQTAFERASSSPAEIVQVRYDSYANLVASGVIGRTPVYAMPDPFPRFAPDPR